MRTRAFSLTKQEAQELQDLFTACSSTSLKRRYQAVLMYGEGAPLEEVQAQTGYSQTAISKICRKYKKGGVEGLFPTPVQRIHARISLEQVKELRELLRSKTPREVFGPHSYDGRGTYWTIPDLRHLLNERYKVTFKTTSAYRNLFSRCGFVYYWQVFGYLDIEQAWRRDREDNT